MSSRILPYKYLDSCFKYSRHNWMIFESHNDKSAGVFVFGCVTLIQLLYQKDRLMSSMIPDYKCLQQIEGEVSLLMVDARQLNTFYQSCPLAPLFIKLLAT